MSIESTKPIVVPPNAQPITYNKVWFTGINIQAPSLAQEPRAIVTFRLYNDDTKEFASGQGQTMIIDKLFTLSATSTAVATAMGSLFAALQEQAQAQGKI